MNAKVYNNYAIALKLSWKFKKKSIILVHYTSRPLSFKTNNSDSKNINLKYLHSYNSILKALSKDINNKNLIFIL